MAWCEQPYPRYQAGVGLTGYAPCNRCKSCIKARKSSWTGRLIGEAFSADKLWWVTLTYGQDDPRAAKADTRDLTVCLQSWRNQLTRKHNGATLRYYAVREQGSTYGRSHFHVLAYIRGVPGNADIGKTWFDPNEKWEHWPHGHTAIVDVPRQGAQLARRVRYCVKYALKGVGDSGTSQVRSSLKPAMGHEFVMSFVDRCVAAAIPLNASYTIAGVKNRDGTHSKFPLVGSLKRRAIERYIAEWTARYPNVDPPVSKWMESASEWARTYETPVRAEQRTFWSQGGALSGRAMPKAPPAPGGYLLLPTGDGLAMLQADAWGGVIYDGGGEVWRSDLANAQQAIKAGLAPRPMLRNSDVLRWLALRQIERQEWRAKLPFEHPASLLAEKASLLRSSLKQRRKEARSRNPV